MTGEGANVRTRVHEYGGGSYVLGGGPDGTDVYYSEFATQRLMKLAAADGEDAVPITEDCENCRYRYADGVYDASRRRIICVREDHTNPKPSEVVNEIVSVPEDGKGAVEVLATGKDFYAAPRLSPDGKRLSYVCWDHPSMPWDATELRVADVDDAANESSQTSAHELIAGNDGDTSVLQPLWHPKTGELFWISDETGYYNIYKTSFGEDAGGNEPVSVLPMDYDFGGKSPGWVLGQQGYDFLPDGRLVASYSKDGVSRMIVAEVSIPGRPAVDVQEYSGDDDGLPSQFGGIVPGEIGTIYFVGGDPGAPPGIYSYSLADGTAAQLARSSTLSIPESCVSTPAQIEFPTVLGTAFGYYYPPANGDYECTMEDAPPLLVKAHGGPTSCASTMFNPSIQYWTSRGFAVLDVDYGGSTGYGRNYRRRLRGAWGVADVDDVCAGAAYLVSKSLADPKRLCIDGGSAGGFTTLGALTFRDTFTAGCSMYGIGDLTSLAGDTHKFESRYLDGLVGPYPAEADLYKSRSPIESAEKLSCPILLLQGEEDRVVPPNQARTMHDALRKKGIPSCLKLYENEQHGFRVAENIEDALDSELAFFGKVYGIDVPDAVELDIENM